MIGDVPSFRHMTQARSAGAGGLFGGPNLPFALATVVALGVLVAYVVLAGPFESGIPTASNSTTPLIAGDVAAGETIFNDRCSVCHGPGGEGITGLGPSLTTSEFAAGLTDAELLAFLQAGRPSDDPLNTTGIAMPARGGTPALSDQELIDVIAYLRTIEPA